MSANLPATMRALLLRRVGHLEIGQLPVPRPAAGEVLVRTAATTICTSDLNDLRANVSGLALPIVLGHEAAGTVAALGAGVDGLRVGDRVTAHPVIPCGACASCRRGLQHLCDDMEHLALNRQGTFAEYFPMPARRLRRVPPGMDLAVAGLMEPVCVCLEALRRARVAAGETVLVVGDGPFGIIIARLAFHFDPARVIVVGRHAYRLAQVPGAVCIDASATADPGAAIRQATGGAGVDAAVLAVGTAAAVDLCVQALRARGRLSIFSAVHGAAPVDLLRVHLKELELLGACNDEDYLDTALACLADPKLRLDQLISHRVPFAQWPTAIDLAEHGKDRALKVALTFEETAGR